MRIKGLPVAGRWRADMILACLVVLFAGRPVWAELPEGVPVEGKTFRARLTTVDENWQLTFDADQAQRVMPAADLVCWGTCVEAVRGPLLVVGDGGLLVANVVKADRKSLTADSVLFGCVQLPLELLAGVVFQLPTERLRRDLLEHRVAYATGKSDCVILSNGDEVTGSIESISEQVICIVASVGRIEIATDRACAVVFNPILVRRGNKQGPGAWVGLADGGRLIARQLTLDNKKLSITIGDNTQLTTAARELIFLQPLGDRVRYLSDLKAAGYRHVPYLDLRWPYQTDRNVTGGRLRSGGRLYLKGVGVHSAARLTYRLTEPYRRFQAEAGIDDSTAGRGSVRFRVYVDGQQKATSEVVRGSARPVSLSVELAGAKRLDLIVDYADRADVLDHADWLHARLVR